MYNVHAELVQHEALGIESLLISMNNIYRELSTSREPETYIKDATCHAVRKRGDSKTIVFSETGFPRLCSLSVVICVLFCDVGCGKTSKSQRTASIDGGKIFNSCRQLSTLRPQTDTQKRLQITQKGPQISTQGLQRDPNKAPAPARGDLRVCPYPKPPNNTQITTYSEHRRGKPAWLEGPGAAEGCCF